MKDAGRLAGLEQILDELLTFPESAEIAPRIIQLEETAVTGLSRIQKELIGISNSVHRELHPEDYDYE